MNLLKYGGIQRKTSFLKGVWGFNSMPIGNESLAVKASSSLIFSPLLGSTYH